MTILGFELAAPALGLGLLLGMSYALLAVGLVLVYRNSKLVNFAHGEIAVGAAVLLWVTVDAGVPYWLAFLAALATGALLAAALERTVINRLRAAPRALAALATLGAGELVLYIALTLRRAVEDRPFPEPPGIPELRIGTLIVQPSEVLALVVGPLAIGALTLFMSKTSWGLALRAAAADLDLARVSGFAGGRLSSSTWGLSGALATVTAILLFGLEPDSPPPTGLDLLLPALTAAVVTGMRNLVAAALAGGGLGILQHLLLWNGISGGTFSVAMFCLIFAFVLAGRGTDTDIDKRTRWLSILPSKEIRVGRLTVPLVPLAAALTGSLALLLVRPVDAAKLTVVFGFVLLALSTAIVTGLSGQLILGQVAYAGLGAMASIAVTLRTGDFFLGFSAGALAGAAAALISSLPAVRRQDLSLAVLSLAFAFACTSWAFHQTWMFARGVMPGRPIIGPFALTSARSYGALALGVLCLSLLVAEWLWRSALARQLVAQRDNRVAAASFGISARAVRVKALLLSGALAGVAGAVLAHAASSVDGSRFPLSDGIRALGGAALGGITSVTGSIWGTLFMVGLPSFAGGILGFIGASWAGWLLLISSAPDGIVSVLARARHADADAEEDDAAVPMLAKSEAQVPSVFARAADSGLNARLLDVRDVSVSFGDLLALDDVSLKVEATEIVGLVGGNGAGKSTLLDVISGALTPNRGEVRFEGAVVNGMTAERRARAGMARSFEGAILFPTLTVLETTLMALEVPRAASTVPRRWRRDRALEIISWIGLERVANRNVGELSTGLRRMAQLACLCARRPRLLLLDEPTSGIAQAELGGVMSLLERVNRELGTSLVLVEHELRVVDRLASRVLVLDAGRVVAEGGPGQVLRSHVQG